MKRQLKPHKNIQEIILPRAGLLEVLSIAHDHLSPISPEVFFDLFQVDEEGVMSSRVIAFCKLWFWDI